MKLLPKRFIFSVLILLFSSLSFFLSGKSAYAQDKLWEIFTDPIKNCGEGEIAMREAEDPAQGGDGIPKISNCRAENARLGAIMYIASDLIFPMNAQLAAADNRPRAIPALGNMMALMIGNPPASGFAYMADVLSNAGFIGKPAYAQGIGFAGLTPLLPLWKASRNIAYAVLIIVMLAIGFMIIFRMKIDPKTVISVQAALPKIILTLILITFSYAIVGFLIDIMYLTIFILIELVTQAVKGANLPWFADYIEKTPQLQQAFVQSGLGGMATLKDAVFSWGMIPSFFVELLQGSWINIVGSVVTGVGVGAILAKLFTVTLAASPIGWLAIVVIAGALAIPVLILLIIFLGLFYTFIRLVFLLFNSYIQLIIVLILAPILLLKEAIPGQSAFENWVKTVMANLIVFPATVAILYMSWVITAIAWRGNMWAPPMVPAGGGAEACILPGQPCGGNPAAIFIGLGIIFMAPNLVASAKKLFQVKPAIPVTAGTAFSPVTGAAGTLMGAASQYYYLSSLTQKGVFRSAWDRIQALRGGKGAPASA